MGYPCHKHPRASFFVNALRDRVCVLCAEESFPRPLTPEQREKRARGMREVANGEEIPGDVIAELADLRARLAACEKERDEARNARDNTKECWDMTCGQIKSMCVRLGADEGDMVDAWMLRDLFSK